MAGNNYTLGRGKIYFARYLPGTETPGPFRYIGNSPELNLSIESESLEHFNSDEGVNEKDADIPTSTSRTGSMVTDNVDADNVALFFFGEKQAITEAGGAVNDEIVGGDDGVVQGQYYQLGTSTQRPTGARGIQASGIVVKDDDTTPTTFAANTDYTVDLRTGLLHIVEGGNIVDGTVLVVDYTVRASTATRVISGATPVVGAMKYVSANPEGDQFDYFMPKTQVRPNGDFALKGDELQQLPFNLEFLKPSTGAAIYNDGEPAFA